LGFIVFVYFVSQNVWHATTLAHRPLAKSPMQLGTCGPTLLYTPRNDGRAGGCLLRAPDSDPFERGAAGSLWRVHLTMTWATLNGTKHKDW